MRNVEMLLLLALNEKTDGYKILIYLAHNLFESLLISNKLINMNNLCHICKIHLFSLLKFIDTRKFGHLKWGYWRIDNEYTRDS